MDVESLAKELILKNMTPEQQMAVLDSVRSSVAQAKEVQKRKIGENVDLVVQALKKIESDITNRFDSVGNSIEKRVASIKDGRDGSNGKDGRDGKDGKSGKDGLKGDKGDSGQDGINGVDGVDGVSVVNANIDFDGSLIISLSDGREINVGEVVSADIAEKIKVINTMSTNAAIAVKEEGTTLTNGVKSINFVGTGITATTSGDDVTVTVAGGGGSGTVTSVAATGGTGISVSGSPITTSGTLTITNTAPDQTVVLTAGTGINTSGTYPSFTVTNSAPDQTVSLTAGTGISTSGTYPSFTITNSAPDQTVALTQGGTTTITGTYPNFTISSADQFQGTVTSVTGTSPVASSGGATPAISLAANYGDTQNPYASKTANFVLAAPNGSAGAPTFRAVVAADIPTLNQNTTGTASNVTGTVAIANGGSGQTTAQLAMNAFAGAVTSGSYLRGNGTDVVMNTIQAADVPTLNQNTTGSAATVTTTINSGVVATTQTSGDNSTKVATTAYVNAITGTSGITGFKNRIINGAMVIDQRSAGASSTTPTVGAGTYSSVDRFAYVVSQASKFTMQQTPSATETGFATRVAAGFSNYLACTVGASANVTVGTSDYFQIYQPIEGLNVSDLAWGSANAKTVTLSFLVYSSVTGTFGGAVRNGSFNRSYPFTYSIPTANTWTSISITIAGDTSGTWFTTNGIGIIVGFNLGSGTTSSATAGAWTAGNYGSATGAVSPITTNSATFYITGVQLEKGSTATSFDYRPYGTELALCQRYFRKTDPSGSYGEGSIFGYNTTNQSIGQAIPFPVQMRSTPTIAFGGTWVVTNATHLLLGGGQSSYLAYLSVTSTGAAQAFGNASGFITFSSEL
jgi:hypothetical protein